MWTRSVRFGFVKVPFHWMRGRYKQMSIVLLVALTATACGSTTGVIGSGEASGQAVTSLPTITTTTIAPTTTEPPPTTTTVPPKGRVVISGVGDVNLDPGFVRTFPTTGYEDAWTGLAEAFVDDDLTIVNLECSPGAGGTPWDKPWIFDLDPDALPSMARAGVEVANLANNHSMDFGFDAMLDGRQRLLAEGIQPVGVGRDRTEAYTPLVFEMNGWTIAVIGSGGVNPETGSWIATDDRPGMTSGDDTESIAQAIRQADEYADFVFVTAHWGKSHENFIASFERGQAEAWIEAGADGIFGHHQHRLLPLEWIDGRPVAFGLGNFVWQAYPEEARRTGIAQIVIEPDGTLRACLVDVFLERTGHPVVQDADQLGCPETAAGP